MKNISLLNIRMFLLPMLICLAFLNNNAHAFILYSELYDKNVGWGIGAHTFHPFGEDASVSTTTACVLLLPLCMLDKKMDGFNVMTKQDLLDQMVPDKEAQSYIDQTKALAENLQRLNQQLIIQASDTKDSLSRDIQTLLPEATEKFVEFYTGQILAK